MRFLVVARGFSGKAGAAARAVEFGAAAVRAAVLAGLVATACALMGSATALSQSNPDQTRQPVMPAHLPDPLVFANGKPVATAEWVKRRQELLHLFTEQMYGRMPGKPGEMRFHVVDLDRHALGGKATREQVSILFRGKEDGPRMDLLVYVPNRALNRGQRPPVILGLNFWGNETIDRDPGIRVSDRWVESGPTSYLDLSCVKNNRATEACRGIDEKRWPVEKILDAGYALATAYRGDIDPDRKDGYEESIRSAWPELAQGGDNFSTIAAWGWAMSRALDYLEQDAQVDGRDVVAFGWSRLGKAAIWAGATDPRFAAVISNESGAGGAKVFPRRARGDGGAAEHEISLLVLRKFQTIQRARCGTTVRSERGAGADRSTAALHCQRDSGRECRPAGRVSGGGGGHARVSLPGKHGPARNAVAGGEPAGAGAGELPRAQRRAQRDRL